MASSSVEMSGGKPGRNSQATCAICEEAPSKYCCPRCEIFYCSVDCYKSEKHQNCSESFYRDCVNDELAGSQTDDESRNKMIEILKRMQKEGNEYPDELNNLLESFQNGEGEDDSDDDDFVDLKDRLNGLNLNDADAVWGALTEDEKNEFEAILNQGDVGEIMPQWDPWWEYCREEKLVQDLLEKEIDDKLEEEKLQRCPELISVPKLSFLTSVQPSPAIRSNITNVLASYALLIRYFNGELEPVEGTSYMLNICANLDTNMNFEESALAVESVVQNCQKSNLIQMGDVSLKVMKHDTFMIIQGPSQENQSYYCRAALSHVHTVFSDAKRAASKIVCNENATKEKKDFTRKYPDHTREHLPKLDVGKVKKCIKKIEYYLAYVESCGMELKE